MLSLFQAVTGGNDWAVYYDILEPAGAWQAFVFLFFLFFFNFSLFNILTGLFVEKAVKAACPSTYELIMQQRKKAHEDSAELYHLCEILDTNNSGSISRSEFESLMLNPTLVAYMAALGLQVHEVEDFFRVVAGSHENDVAIDRFVEGCMLMKGAATALDVQSALYEVRSLHDHTRRSEKRCVANLLKLEQWVQSLAEQQHKLMSVLPIPKNSAIPL
jgi:hypothetical protein